MNRADRGKQPYNHSSGGKSFLQQHHELATQQGHPTDCVELFKETHARGGQFVLQVAADGHVSLIKNHLSYFIHLIF